MMHPPLVKINPMDDGIPNYPHPQQQTTGHHHHRHHHNSVVVSGPRSRQNSLKGLTCDFSSSCISDCEVHHRVCPFVLRKAGYAASKAQQKMKENSRIFNHQHPINKHNNQHYHHHNNNNNINKTSSPKNHHPKNQNNLKMIRLDDVTVLQKLGEGSFCHVNSCLLLVHEDDDDDENNHHNHDNDKHQHKHSKKAEECAVKSLNHEIMVNPDSFEIGACDLAIETQFLRALDHPHIIKLHGIMAGSITRSGSYEKKHGFSLVLDRLYETLEEKIRSWHEQEQQQQQKKKKKHAGFLSRIRTSSSSSSSSSSSKQQEERKFTDRLRVALQIADVMEYLHRQHIIFRDLKPNNIGFDKEGQLKLFDFGLAKEIKRLGMSTDPTGGYYELSGGIGSRKYMAPEVAQNRPYDLSVDVYSFGIILWECYAPAPKEVSCEGGGARPTFQHPCGGGGGGGKCYWPPKLQQLITNCVSEKSKQRPSFTTIKQILLSMM